MHLQQRAVRVRSCLLLQLASRNQLGESQPHKVARWLNTKAINSQKKDLFCDFSAQITFIIIPTQELFSRASTPVCLLSQTQIHYPPHSLHSQWIGIAVLNGEDFRALGIHLAPPQSFPWKDHHLGSVEGQERDRQPCTAGEARKTIRVTEDSVWICGGKAGLLSSCTLHSVEMCPNCKAAYHKDLAHKKITMPKAHCRENATSLRLRPQEPSKWNLSRAQLLPATEGRRWMKR